MFSITFWRGLKAGTKNFFRNGWLSIATISIIVLTLFIVNTVLIITVIANKTIQNIQQKIDISVYLKNDASESDTHALVESLKNMPEVSEVKYISEEEALNIFRGKHLKDDVILESLEELGNPLQASVSIKMKRPEDYQTIIGTLNDGQYKDILGDFDYYADKKPMIEKLNQIIKTIKKIGAVIISIFSVVAVLVTFNSIRLTMYNYKREVEIMKLVGANPWFIRLPFIIEGMLYGFFAAWISIFFFYPFVYFASPYVASVAPEVNVVEILENRAIEIILIQILSGVMLGALSSLIAIRKYLKI